MIGLIRLPANRSACAVRPILRQCSSWGLALGLGTAVAGVGAEMVRGPYLQMATPNSIIIKWRTDVPVKSVVYYGTNALALNNIVGLADPTTDHGVKLTGLEPGTRYYYGVGTLTELFTSGPDHFFKTHPPAGSSVPTRIWVLGDSGTESVGQGNARGVRDAYANFAGTRQTDVWLMLGDNAYNYGTDQEYQVAVFNTYPRFLRNTTLWPTVGNHETYGSGANGQFAYHNIFTLPTRGEAGGIPSGTENYYSFDYANIHFVCLDSELSDRSLAGPMLTWLAADLAANTNLWVIAFWHSPPYSKGSHDSDSLLDNGGNMTLMRTNAVQLLESYGVDLVLCGHSHNYERSYLINGHYGFSTSLTPGMIKDAGTGQPAGTGAYVKSLTGPDANQGAVYAVVGSSGWATFRYGRHPIMCYDALTTGSLVIDVDGPRLEARYLRESGAVDDYFTIMKSNTPEPLRLVTFQIRNGLMVARWKSIAGQTYVLEFSPTLASPLWETISNVITATGATTSWTNTFPNWDRGFLRVVNRPNP